MLKRFLSLFLIAALLMLSFTSASGGSVSDPAVTLSYINQVFKPDILSRSMTSIDTAFAALRTELNQKFGNQAPLAGLYAAAYLRSGGVTVSNTPATYALSPGCVVLGSLGTGFTLTEGDASTYTPTGSVLVNVTDGEAYLHGNTVIPMNRYMVADEGQIGIAARTNCVVTITGQHVIVGIAAKITAPGTQDPQTPIDPANYTARYTKYAHALNAMELFRGTNNGFELERSANRAEALTMLIRILGEEQQALVYTGKHPFKDVPAWADRYVAYAYNKGYTNGVSATKFGASDPVSEAQYLTFLLRSLGYSDAAGDFVWSEAPMAAVRYGLLTYSEEAALQTVFYRDQVVFTSYKALYTPMKGSTSLLYEKLLSAGAITIEGLYRAGLIVS